MLITDKISNYVKTGKKNKLPIDEKIEYLKYLKEQSIDISAIDKNFVSKEGIIVQKVISNLIKLYKQNKLTIKQIIECEIQGVKFLENNLETEDEINFLKKAQLEINLSQISIEYEKFENTTVYKCIESLREKYEKKELTSRQLETCCDSLKIIIPKEKMKEKIMKIIKEGTLKNLLLNKEIKQTM